MVRLFRVFIPLSVLILLISEILLVVLTYVVAAYIGYEGDPYEYLVHGTGSLNIALVVICIIVGLYLHDLYSDLFVKSHLTLIQQLCFILGSAFLLQGAVTYLDRSLRMPLYVMVPGSAMAIAVIYGWRVLFSTYAIGRMGGDRLLLLGSSPRSRKCRCTSTPIRKKA